MAVVGARLAVVGDFVVVPTGATVVVAKGAAVVTGGATVGAAVVAKHRPQYFGHD